MKLPFVWRIHKGGGPAGDRERASAAGVRHTVQGLCAAPAVQRIKARSSPSNQSTEARIQEVERKGDASVQPRIRFGDSFSTSRAAPGPDRWCDHAFETGHSAPTEPHASGARADPSRTVTQLRSRCAGSLKPDYQSTSNTDRCRASADRMRTSGRRTKSQMNSPAAAWPTADSPCDQPSCCATQKPVGCCCRPGTRPFCPGGAVGDGGMCCPVVRGTMEAKRLQTKTGPAPAWPADGPCDVGRRKECLP